MPRQGYQWSSSHRAHRQASVAARGFGDVLEAIFFVDGAIVNRARSSDSEIPAADRYLAETLLAKAQAVLDDHERRIARRPPRPHNVPRLRDEHEEAWARQGISQICVMLREQIQARQVELARYEERHHGAP